MVGFELKSMLEQIVQISVISISNKSILMKRKEWYNVSLTLLYTRCSMVTNFWRRKHGKHFAKGKEMYCVGTNIDSDDIKCDLVWSGLWSTNVWM